VREAIRSTLSVRQREIEERVRADEAELAIAKDGIDVVEGKKSITDHLIAEILKGTETGLSFTKLYEFNKANGYSKSLVTKVSSRLSPSDPASQLIVLKKPYNSEGLTAAEDDRMYNESRIIDVPILMDVYTSSELEDIPRLGSQSIEFIGHLLEVWNEANPEAFLPPSSV
jgi:hypothetical protein